MNKKCLACFKAISDNSRSKIYEFVQSGKSKTVSEVVSHFKLTQPTVSYHLMELAKTGLLKRIKKGREVYYDAQCTCGCGECKCPVAD
ncbi:metalloregulator ArsR/SmtB family transcription factor [Candidatus Parcubacteria bacterium]|nr:metalloregulator ArsR/SmtB family transcription factor [Patescibacteria group bacterium]MBU4381100.1 metalloregulator ArsR/SmtB family transcription factor [Patescibacteria group bacterium]MCG2689177.1 metalloregulator ArsR/SmtB family transcription factor [Candidatus Parcubacteria bacterium]